MPSTLGRSATVTPTRRTLTNGTRNANSNGRSPAPPAPKRHDGVWWRHDNPRMISRTLSGYSLSEAAGHASFVGVCVAYLHTDIFMLRVLTMGTMSLSIVFQYYRAVPLWIPIRWNALLLGINAFMTASLIVEERRASEMPPAMEGIYKEGHFRARGFSRVEFVRLFARAQRIELKQGTTLARDCQVNNKLYFVTQGSVRIERDGRQIALVHPNQFIGEMTFLNHLLVDDGCHDAKLHHLIVAADGVHGAKAAATDPPPSNDDDDAGTTTIATADAVVQDKVAVAYWWDFDSLKCYLRGDREVSNALSAYMNHDLRAKLACLHQK